MVNMLSIKVLAKLLSCYQPLKYPPGGRIEWGNTLTAAIEVSMPRGYIRVRFNPFPDARLSGIECKA